MKEETIYKLGAAAIALVLVFAIGAMSLNFYLCYKKTGVLACSAVGSSSDITVDLK